MQRAAVVIISVIVLSSTVGVVGATNVLSVDGDSTPVATELMDGTDPLVADTDGDNVSDGEERDGLTDPTRTDTDDDGLDDGTELAGPTDATDPDTDEDGLTDGREAELDTNAAVADTDGDSLDDPRELAEDTDPTAADTDGDGVDDGRELASDVVDATVADTDDDSLDDGTELTGPTDPADPDTDGDGLTDGREAELGTNATLVDTDGDTLDDAAEVRGETQAGIALPDADPLRMDLYTQVYTGASSSSPSDYEAIENDWARMPVANPDGSTGITLHVRDQGTLDQRHTFDGSTASFRGLYDEAEALAGASMGPYRVVMFVEFDAGRYVGMGRVGGHFSVVNGDRPDLKQRKTMNHELLHNVVGRVDAEGRCPDEPAHYCDGGWLAPTINDERSLPEPIGEELAENGFEE